MEPERWQQIEHLFHAANELKRDERDVYLIEACGADQQLLSEVKSLIASYEYPDSFIDEPAFNLGMNLLADEQERFSVSGTIGPYRLVAVLGTGGMGEVFLAHDSRLGRKVALKLLPPSLSEDSGRISRFRQEARTASTISHPNVAHIYEAGEADGRHYIAMELVDGITLRHKLNKGRIPIEEAISIAYQTACALSAAHVAGIVHRDIKPENIMLRPDGYVKVLDFGLAKTTKEQAQLLANLEDSTIANLKTDPGAILGTILYMSPEQLRGQSVDARTDIWSLGITLYEMITGQAPFDWSTKSDTIASILDREPRPLTSFTSDRSDRTIELQRIISKLLSKDREQRYQSIEALLLDLKKLKLDLELTVNLDRLISGSDDGKNQSLINDQQLPTEIVEKAPRTSDLGAARPTLKVDSLIGAIKEHQGGSLLFVAVLVLLGTLIYVYLIPTLRSSNNTAQLLEFTKLPITSNAKEAAISANGKYIAIIVDEAGKQSLWIRQINTSNNLQIVPPTEAQYKCLVFSPDGDYIYYLKEEGDTAALYRISILGGITRRLCSNIETAVTFSPKGDQLAFVRFNLEDQSTSLVVSNRDCTESAKLATLTQPQSFNRNGFYSSRPAWSPDGSVIACPTYNTTIKSQMEIVSVQVRDGSIRRLNTQKWYLIEKLVWLSDGSGIIMNAADQKSSTLQIWHISYPTGEARKITNDPNSYVDLSATADAETLLTLKVDKISTVWILSGDTNNQITQVASSKYGGATGISWTPDGKIVYASNETGSQNIWIMDGDGNNRNQLTFNQQTNIEPTVSPDGLYIVYVSFGEVQPHLWRIDIDGANMQKLTSGIYEDTPQFSLDGNWIVYHSINEDMESIWKISIDGKANMRLTKDPSTQPDISPDGKMIACFSHSKPPNSPWKIMVIPSDGGQPIKSFNLPATVNPVWPGVRWAPDGLSVTYVVTSGDLSNIWSQPLSGGPAKQLTDFKENQIHSFAWSATTKKLACVRGSTAEELFLLRNF